MSANTAVKPQGSKDNLLMALTFALPIAVMFIPSSEMLTMQLKSYLAITLFAILAIIFENINTTAISVLFPIAYVVLAKAPAAAVYAPWTTYIPWFIIGGLFLANVMDRTNLLKRIAYNSILITGAKFNGIIYGLALAGVALYLLIPGNTVFPLAALAFGICKALDLKIGRATAGITMAAAIASLLPGWFIFNANWGLLTGLVKEVVPVSLSWLQYLGVNSIAILFYVFMFFVITQLFKPDAAINAKEYFRGELAKLGKMSLDEKKVLVMCAMLLVYLLTVSYHKIEAGWGFVIFPMLLYFPGFNVAVPDDIKKINYGMAIFTAACMGIGTTAGALGVGKIVAAVAMPLLAGQSVTFVFAAVFIMIFVLNFLMTPLAIMSAFSLPLVQIGMNFNINPAAMLMFIQMAIDQIILPYEYVLYLIFFSFGLVKLSDFAKFQAAKSVLAMVFFFLILIPFWRMIGFLML